MIIRLLNDEETIIDDIDNDLDEFVWHVCGGYVVRAIYDANYDRHGTVSLSSIILERKLGRSINRSMICNHIDTNRLNNKRNNLREITPPMSIRGSDRHRNSTSGYRGVRKRGNGWQAQIRIDGIQTSLGTYYALEEACKAFLDKYYEIHGKYPPEIEEKT